MTRIVYVNPPVVAPLPPDLTAFEPGDRDCPATLEGWLCTRSAGHAGWHRAGTGSFLAATWDDLPDLTVDTAARPPATRGQS